MVYFNDYFNQKCNKSFIKWLKWNTINEYHGRAQAYFYIKKGNIYQFLKSMVNIK